MLYLIESGSIQEYFRSAFARIKYYILDKLWISIHLYTFQNQLD